MIQNFLVKEDEFRQQLEKKITTEEYGRNIELVVGFLSLGTSMLNVVFQYLEPEPGPDYSYFNNIDYAVCIYFLMVFLLKLYVTTDRLNHLSQTQSILELIVFLPILLFIKVSPESQLYILIPFSRYIRSIQAFMIFSRYFKMGQTDVDRQINIVFITMLLLTYISSGIYSIVENRERKITDSNFLQLHDSVYFVIVTLATVGYGDEIPATEIGRVVVLIIIFLTIVLIPAQTNELLRLMSIRSRFRRTEYKSLDVQHIVICGSVDLDALENFCHELYHPDHGGDATNIVIIQDFDPDGDMDSFMNKNFLSMTYLAGDAFEESDLARSMLHTAEQCIVLTNKNSKDSCRQDYKNILTALALKKFVYDKNKHMKDEEKQNLQLCLQLIKPESKYLYYKSLNMSAENDKLIIVEEIKMNLLAKSCFAPGLIACMSNLAASASTDDLELEKEWLNEYANGMGHEIYRMQISEGNFSSPLQLTFRDIADLCFFEFQSLIFALEIQVKETGQSIVRLNPAQFVIEDWDRFNYYLYIICEDESNAEQVQAMDIEDETFEQYFGRPRNLMKFEDGPQNAQDGAEQNSPGGINDIDNPELMQMQTADNFYKKNEAASGQAKNEQIEELKYKTPIQDPDEDESPMVRKITPTKTIFKKKDKIVEKSFLNKSNILNDNLKNVKAPKQKQKVQSTRENELERNYDLLLHQQTLTEVMLNDKNIKLKNHIVVCGFHSSIYHFILPLRAKYLMSYQQDIVIVAPHIKQEIWEVICRFPRVFVVEGSPLSHEILRQACIKKASKAVIMGYDPAITTETFSELTEELIDAKSIFIYKAIKEMNPKLQVFTEIFYQSNIDFLNSKPSKNKALGYNFSSHYAAGEVYIASTIDTLTAQSFYNPHIITIFQQILVGKGERKSETEDPEQEIQDMFDERLEQSNLWQILVPEEFVNQTYKKLFKHLLERNLVSIGLYRLPGATDNKSAYCYTNPDSGTIITYMDRVFVLGKEIPDDISLDIKQVNKFQDENQTAKKLKASILKAQQQKETAEAYYGINKKENQETAAVEEEEKKEESPRAQSEPRSSPDDQVLKKTKTAGVLSFKNGTTFGPRSQTPNVDRSPTLSIKKQGTKQDKHRPQTSIAKERRKNVLSIHSAQSAMQFDDTQDQQITSMEFMLRAINQLENQLGDIENKVYEVRQKIAHQNQKIKKNVRQIKQKNAGVKIEQSGFQN